MLFRSQIRHGMDAQGMLDELLTDKLKDLLHTTNAQPIADALYLTAMRLDRRLIETLLIVHEFLDNYACIVAHSTPPEDKP